VAVVVPVAGLATVGLVANRATAGAETALADEQWQEAEGEARRAIRWAPWSGRAWELRGNAQLALGKPRDARRSLRRAAEKDPGDWRIWYDLGTASTGAARERAYRRAATLNPLAQDIDTLRELRYALPAAPNGASGG
jgi:tetratricopeptide (TPR) repeat protein